MEEKSVLEIKQKNQVILENEKELEELKSKLSSSVIQNQKKGLEFQKLELEAQRTLKQLAEMTKDLEETQSLNQRLSEE